MANEPGHIPEIWIIAGPNGSGKTTWTNDFQTKKLIPNGLPIINADEIASKMDDKDQIAAFKVAREALNLRKSGFGNEKVLP